MSLDIERLSLRRRKWVEANRENNFEDGIKRLLTELYPDNAHFIYELLQNAEDTGATEVRFRLYSEGIDFEHNGNRLFSLADVDAITSIGFSTKCNDPTSIGKFGIGFKAVFSYTETPEIHSGDYHFRIRDLVVPETNGVNKPRMDERETHFIFPFDHQKKPPKQASAEIEQGLRALGDNTLLFLSHIRTIEYLLTDGSYGSLNRIDHEGGRIEIRSSHPGGNDTVSQWLRFQKDVEVVDEDGKLKPCRIAIAYSLVEEDKKKSRSKWKIVPLDNGQVFIYFPAEKETSNLRFHLHAPFASTVARDSVRDCNANYKLRDYLTDLVVESLTAIRDQGMLTVGFLAVLPNKEDGLSTFYEPIRKAVVHAFQNEPLTPTKSGTHAPAGGLYRGPARIADVLNDDDLSFLKNYNTPLWASNPPQQNQREDRFLDSLSIDNWSWSELVSTLNSLYRDEDRERFESWISQKEDAWLMRFYGLLGEAIDLHYQYVSVKNLRIVRIEKDNANDHLIPEKAFFPSDDGTSPPSGIYFVKPTVYSSGRSEAQKKYARLFLDHIGVRPFDAKAAIKLRLAQYDNPPRRVENDYYKDLKHFISYWKNNPNESSLFTDCTFLIGVSDDGKLYWCKPTQLCLDNPYLETGLAELAYIHKKYVVWYDYQNKLSKSQLKDFTDFLKAIRIMYGLEIESCSTNNNPKAQELKQDFCLQGARWRTGSAEDIDYSIDELDKYLNARSISASRLIWNALIHADADSAKAQIRPNQQYGIRKTESQLVYYLKHHAWIPDKSGEFRKPLDMTKDDLRKDFPYDDRNGLLTAIGFGEHAKKRSEEYQTRNNAAQKLGFTSAEQAEKLVKLIKETGMTPDEIRLCVLPYAKKEKPEFPTKASSNPERRRERLSEQLKEVPKKEYEKRERSVRTTKAIEEVRVWLRNRYTNQADQMICQVCQEEMPFKGRDGEYYFEAVEALSKDHFPREHEAQFLALCPLCAAMYNEFVKHDERAMETFKETLINSEEPEIPLQLGDLNTSIRFVESHWQDIKTIIQHTGL